VRPPAPADLTPTATQVGPEPRKVAAVQPRSPAPPIAKPLPAAGNPARVDVAKSAGIPIPQMKWSSAPPPIPPRSFSTPPPPPPSSPTLVTEPPPPAATPAAPAVVDSPPPRTLDLDDEPEDEPTRIQPDDIRRAVEIREESRLLVREAIDEALAPLHYALRALERRVESLEANAGTAPAAPPPAAAPMPPVMAPPAALARAIPPPAAASVIVQPDPRDPYGAVAPAPAPAPADVITIPPAPRAPALDWDTAPFDGARRRRRLAIAFGFFVLLIFGALFGALIWSRVG
jgi:hypothetical protein